jgi:hypothetical protein
MKLYTNKQIEEIKSKAAADAISKYTKELQNEYNAIENAIKARAECAASFDFNDEDINVFSVERIEMPSFTGVPNSRERTVIGYFIFDENGGTIIKEWTLYCSREDHNKLVEEFRASKKNIKQEKPASKKSLIKG